jgi:hypothetical protein
LARANGTDGIVNVSVLASLKFFQKTLEGPKGDIPELLAGVCFTPEADIDGLVAHVRKVPATEQRIAA